METLFDAGAITRSEKKSLETRGFLCWLSKRDFCCPSCSGLLRPGAAHLHRHRLLCGVGPLSSVSDPVLGLSLSELLGACFVVFTITAPFAHVNLGVMMRRKHFEWRLQIRDAAPVICDGPCADRNARL